MSFHEIHYLHDVFTPTSPARLTFIERDLVNDSLVQGLRIPGRSVIVYGQTGAGKTTLLVNKLHQMYEDHITTRCYEGMAFDQLLLNAFDQLNLFYDSERVHAKKSELSSSIQAEYLVIKSQIGSTLSNELQAKQQRALPPQLTLQTLAKFLGEANCCWVLEDFHRISSSEKTQMSQAMKMFMDMSYDYRDIKIVVVGAGNGVSDVLEYHNELRGRLITIHVPPMTNDEIKMIITMGEKLLNFYISDNAKDLIARKSDGLASVCHQLCLDICLSVGIEETQRNRISINDDEVQEVLDTL